MAGRIISPELIGREAELALVERALTESVAYRSRTVLIGGEAGIGKTRLLEEVMTRARAEGATVLLGGCIGLAEGALPFAPIVEAIRPLVRVLEHDGDGAADPDRLPERDALVAVAGELGLSAGRRSSPSSAAAELRPEWARSRAYEAFLELLRRLGERRPVVLAVEDLHWADDSTRELLAFLVRNAQQERLLLLVTFRSDELHRRHPLLPWLAEVDRSTSVERVELHRLPRDDVARQLYGITGRVPEPSLIDSVFERAEGNPFFAEELIAAGAETRRLPPTLHEVLAARLAHVTEPTLRLLGVAAVVGRRVDHDLLAELAGLTERELDDGLHEATAALLLVADEEADEGYAFRHALLAEAAAETVLPGRRRRLHVAIASALQAMPPPPGARGAAHLAEIAHHWFEARELGPAFCASQRAGDAATEAGAYAEALRQYDRVLELWDVTADPEQAIGFDRVECLRRAAHAAQLSGEYAHAAALLGDAIRLAEAAGDAVRAGLLLERLGRARWTSGEFDGALQAYARAVELVPSVPPSADLARVLAGYSQALMLSGRYAESHPIAVRALDLARAVGARQLEGHATATVGTDLAFVGDIEEGIALIREALAIAEEVGDHDDVGRAYACLSTSLDIAGRLDEAETVAAEGAERLRALGMGATYGTFLQMNVVDELAQLGRWDEALRIAIAVEPIGRGNSRLVACQHMGRIYALRGQFDAAGRALEVAVQMLRPGTEAQFNGPLAVNRLELAAWTGDIDGGRRAADESLPILAQTEDRAAVGFLVAAALRVEADAAERGRAARDDLAVAVAMRRADALLARARALDDEALPSAYRVLVRLAVAFAEAEAGRAAGRSDPSAWRLGVAGADARPNVYLAAYARYRLAEALLPDRPARDEAAAILGLANAAATALGAEPLREAIEALAARGRLALADLADVAGRPAPATDGAVPEGLAAYDLTPREIEVLRLVATGRTNRQIGEVLFISESTAGVHVSRILGKLGVSGRVEAATIAARLGLDG